MSRLCFKENVVNLIMNCITTSTFSKILEYLEWAHSSDLSFLAFHREKTFYMGVELEDVPLPNSLQKKMSFATALATTK